MPPPQDKRDSGRERSSQPSEKSVRFTPREKVEFNRTRRSFAVLSEGLEQAYRELVQWTIDKKVQHAPTINLLDRMGEALKNIHEGRVAVSFHQGGGNQPSEYFIAFANKDALDANETARDGSRITIVSYTPNDNPANRRIFMYDVPAYNGSVLIESEASDPNRVRKVLPGLSPLIALGQTPRGYRATFIPYQANVELIGADMFNKIDTSLIQITHFYQRRGLLTHPELLGRGGSPRRGDFNLKG